MLPYMAYLDPMGYGTLTIVNGFYTPTYNWGGHIVWVLLVKDRDHFLLFTDSEPRQLIHVERYVSTFKDVWWLPEGCSKNDIEVPEPVFAAIQWPVLGQATDCDTNVCAADTCK